MPSAGIFVLSLVLMDATCRYRCVRFVFGRISRYRIWQRVVFCQSTLLCRVRFCVFLVNRISYATLSCPWYFGHVVHAWPHYVPRGIPFTRSYSPRGRSSGNTNCTSTGFRHMETEDFRPRVSDHLGQKTRNAIQPFIIFPAAWSVLS